jgi:lipopolysaccharide/colanic/teichoic acid biosynthesis glycosyltransferase
MLNRDDSIQAQARSAPRKSFEPDDLRSLVASAIRADAVGHRIHSPEEIKRILHRECARCERSGSEFCLVVIDPGHDPEMLKRLEMLLRSAVRQSDEIGYLDERRLCIMLTYTVPAGARQFMERFLERASALGDRPNTQLFVYPSDSIEAEIDGNPTDTNQVPDNRSQMFSRQSDTEVAGVERLLARRSPLWKRATDILLAGSALLVLWPLGIAIAIVIKLGSKGPVFFTQERSGQGGRVFKIYKFRTMIPNADQLKETLLEKNEQEGPAFKMKHDPRVTRVGRFLRSTSLDELPQLLNVLRGDMSLVGPRPLPVTEALNCHPWQKRRLDVVPGLTCTWQIHGRGKVSFSEWARMDREYIRNQSFMNDAKLLALTVPAVLTRRGAM